MSDVIEFPSGPIREWRGIEEKTLRPILRGAGAPSEMEDEICARFKDTYLEFCREIQLSFTLPFPASLSDAERETLTKAVKDAILDLSKQFQSVVSEMLFRMLILEMQLYGLKPRQK